MIRSEPLAALIFAHQPDTAGTTASPLCVIGGAQ